MQYLKQSTASQTRMIGPFVDETDGSTAETGLTIANTDIRLSANGGNMVAKNSGGGTHDELGMYAVTFDATDTATVGELAVNVKMAGALPVFHKFYVLEESVFDALFGASAAGFDANGEVTVAAYNSSLDFTATQKASINTEADTALTDYDAPTKAELDAGLAALNDPTAAAIRAEIDANSTQLAAIVADTNELQTDDVPGLIAALNDPTAAAIRDAILDRVLATNHDTAGTVGKLIQDIFADTNELQTDDIPGTLATISGYIDTEVAAIKAVTDNLPDSGALTSIAQASALTTVDNEVGAIQADLDNATDGLGALKTLIDAVQAAVDVLPSAADVNSQVDAAWTTQMADSVSTDGTIATREQALYMVLQYLTESSVSGTTVTVKKPDGSTSLMTLTLNDGTTPTSITRAT